MSDIDFSSNPDFEKARSIDEIHLDELITPNPF